MAKVEGSSPFIRSRCGNAGEPRAPQEPAAPVGYVTLNVPFMPLAAWGSHW